MATKKKATVAKSPSRKKTASKKKTAKKIVRKKHAAGKLSTGKAEILTVELETRQKMIAEEAYFLSLQRCSEDGSALEDWLLAEAQVDQKLARRKD